MLFTHRRVGAVAGTAGLIAALLQPTAGAQAATAHRSGTQAAAHLATAHPATAAEATHGDAGSTVGHLSAAQAVALGRNADEPVIVVFRNQEPALPATRTLSAARSTAVAAVQRPVVAELDQLRAPALETYSLVNAVSATVSAAEAARLASDPAVAEVVPDESAQLAFPAPPSTAMVPAAGSPSTQPAAGPASQAVCQRGAGGVELDPQALSAIHANGAGPTAASLGITGAGVKVAFMAEQFNVDQPNFQRSNGSHVVVDYADFTGEGTTPTSSGGEASLDASSIAAQGKVVYSGTFANGHSCSLRILGAAPGASLVALKVFPASYDATTTALLDGINYAVVKDHVDVLSQSFGYNPLPDTMTDIIRMADEAAVRAGTVVDVSSGDAGPTSTVGSPSTDPAVISAGASTTYRVYAQEDIANYEGLGATGWENDNLSALSSAGFTEGLKGPNLIAPGDLNWVTCNPSAGQYGACISGGTSEAAPLTSATAALVIQAFRKTHGGASPTPALVKRIIVSTTSDLGLPADQQGAGLLDSYRAVLAAESIKTPKGAPKPKGSTLVTDTTSISAMAAGGTTVARDIKVTNLGSRAQTVRLHGRILSAPVPLSSHAFKESSGSWHKVITFKVRPATSYLAAHVATVPTEAGGFIDVTLLDPLRRLAVDGIPQGSTGTSNVGVRDPMAGTWTAYLDYEGPGSTGPQPVDFTATSQDWTPFGTVTPARLTLTSGATASVRVSVTTPAAAGDESAAVELDPSAGAHLTIPVALRSLVPIRGGKGVFSATVIGGNGRGGAPSSTEFFAFNVAKGEPELNVTTAFANGPDNDYSLYVVSPQGETLGHASNQLVVGGTAADPTTVSVPGAVSHVVSPAAGRWTVIVAFADPASGGTAATRLNGTVDFSRLPVATAGLPTSIRTAVPVGSSRVVKVTVTNTAAVPQSYFLDARLKRSVTETLAPLSPAGDISLPLGANAPIPQWIVPTETTSLVGRINATAPATFDMSPYLGNYGGELNGDPQIGAARHVDSATARWTDHPITPGVWNLDPALTGTFGVNGAPPETASLSLTATTNAFNPAFDTTYGDFWKGTGTVAPVTVGPGQTVTLYAVLSPVRSGPVAGTLYLDTATDISPFGSAIAAGDQAFAIRYAYTAR